MKHDIGARRWHRIFGWVTITHPYTDSGKTLVNSDYKHIKQYVAGKGWIDCKGENGGVIKSIFVHRDELFHTEQKDQQQGLINMMVKVIN